jgi:competence protein ComEC
MVTRYSNTIGMFVSVLCVMLVPSVSLCEAPLTIHCIDVGQGDCTLIVSAAGGTLLFDAGINGKGNSVVIPYLQGLGLTGLDYISCSHYHVDHIGGIDEVVNNLGIDSIRVAVLDRGWSYTTLTYEDYADAVAPKRTEISDGQVIDLGGGVTVTCVTVNGNGELSPPFLDENHDENDMCVGLLVEYGEFDFFVAGDLSGKNTSYYTDIETPTAPDVGDVDIYRVDHHGSASNSNVNLVSTLHPEVSIISVGDNSYGHPTQTVIDRLVSYDSYIYQTELGDGGTIPSGEGEVVGGHIVIEVQPGSYTVNGDLYDLGSSGVEIAGTGLSFRVWPNPFSDETVFRFEGAARRNVQLEIYDVRGRLVSILPTGASQETQQTLSWDGRSITGQSVSPGVYFVRLSGLPHNTSAKLVKR